MMTVVLLLNKLVEIADLIFKLGAMVVKYFTDIGNEPGFWGMVSD